MKTPSHDLKKIAIIGPECTGKSDLSVFLANYFKTVWVPEYARQYIDNLERPYTQDDLPAIARGQLLMEDERMPQAKRVMICDTNLYVVKVWSLFKFGTCDPGILESIATRPYDLYLLTYVDIPWQEDPQREHPHKRQQLYDLYRTEMVNQPVPFVEISGNREHRQKTAIDAIERILAR
jgi:NadR type nicotinamide-nucleotide adenylyltransferase